MKLIIPLVTLLLLYACQTETEKPTEKAVAKVYDKYLYLNELMEIIPEELSAEDSLTFVQNYIDKWIKKQLKLKQAEKNLPEKEKDVSKLLEEYRSSLLIYKYEQFLIEQKMKTDITEEQLLNYYEKNGDEFPLTKNAIIPLYIKFPKETPDLYKVRRWYKLNSDEDFEQLEDFCLEYAEEFYFEDDWIYFSELKKKIPIETTNPEQFLKYTKHYESQDSAYTYFLNIVNYKLKGDVSPLQFVQDIIKTIIINKRKQNLIKTLENSMYDENINEIEIFND